MKLERSNRETGLLLLLSRVNPERSVFERAEELIDPAFDWEAFTSLSIRHGTSAIIYKNLLNLKNVPQDTNKRFHAIYNNSLRSNILMISELDRLTDKLSGAGIDVISLKGAAASEKIFGDIGLYPSSDIDILVNVEDIDRVRVVLEADGYKLNDTGFDQQRRYFIDELYHISLSNGRFTVEPHWNLFMRYFKSRPEFWWEESVSVSSGGRQYKFLSPEKNILYTCFRLFSKGFANFRFLVLVAEILRYYRVDIAWDKLFAYARQYKFESALRLTLKLAHDLLDAPIFAGFEKLRNQRSRILYLRAVRIMFFGGEPVHPLDKAAFAFLNDDPTALLKMLCKRVFPSKGEIIARYGLPTGSKVAILYYLLNPFLLMIRKHQK